MPPRRGWYRYVLCLAVPVRGDRNQVAALTVKVAGIRNGTDHQRLPDTVRHALGNRVAQAELTRLGRLLKRKDDSVTGGPTPPWLERARNDADVVFSGAENMMTDYIKQLADTAGGRGPRPWRIDESTIVPLYLRPVVMLVHPGNPKRIRRFEDLLRPGMKGLVVQGAGQNGLWEDVAGRTGDIRVVHAFRHNIGAVAENSGVAKQRWTDDKSFDAWLIWNVWQVANPTLAEAIPVAERWRIYRDAGVALTVKGRERTAARDFAAFLQSPEGARIFARWGWMTPGRKGR